MKTSTTITALFGLLACASCDKARELADRTLSDVQGKIAASGTAADAVDPELAALVDETDEGVVFRKDLPFPENIEVRETRKHDWSGRLIVRNEIEPRVETFKGVRSSTHVIVGGRGEIRYTIEQSAFTLPTASDDEAAPKSLTDPFRIFSPGAKTLTFRQHGDEWRADAAGGFRAAAIAKDLSPVMRDLQVQHALVPRALWFKADKRFQPGDTLTVGGDSLPMLVAGKANGELRLTMVALEPVGGHPCAVFSVEGDYTRGRFPDFDGQFSDDEVTIQAGKLWLSLIHPLILREELDTIQSIKTGSAGAPAAHVQGAVKVTVTREWKTV